LLFHKFNLYRYNQEATCGDGLLRDVTSGATPGKRAYAAALAAEAEDEVGALYTLHPVETHSLKPAW
jgi:hypothetical protein